MTTEEMQEGLVLRRVDYKDRQKIITIFTPQRGLVSLIVKGITRKKTNLLTLTSPFTRAQYNYRIGRSDLYQYLDGTPLATHHNIRNNLDHIETAAELVKALLLTQMPGKAAPALYALTISYLHELHQFKNPTTLSSSFFLKLLKHDGLLALSPNCSHCKNESTHLHLGESYCQSHTPHPAHHLTTDEWNTLHTLADTRAFDPLKEITLTHEFHTQIKQIFDERIREG